MVSPKQFGRVEEIADMDTGGTVTLASPVETYRSILIEQTTAGQAITLPNPADADVIFSVDVSNIGTASFTLNGATLAPSSSTRISWSGGSWNNSASAATLPLTAQGSLITADATNTPIELPVGASDGQALLVDSSTASGLVWGGQVSNTATSPDPPGNTTVALGAEHTDEANFSVIIANNPNVTFTLPNPTDSLTKRRKVTMLHTGTEPVTIDPDSGASFTLSPGDAVDIHWNGAAWVRSTGAAPGAIALNDLTDVDTATNPPVASSVLSFNGTEWVPQVPAAPTFEYVHATPVSTTTTSFVDLSWNVQSGAIPYGATLFTLSANKTYELEAHVGGSNGPGDWGATVTWRDAANVSLPGQSPSLAAPLTSAFGYWITTTNKVVFTPAVDTQVKVRVARTAGTGTVGVNTGYVFIKEITAPAVDPGVVIASNCTVTASGAAGTVNGAASATIYSGVPSIVQIDLTAGTRLDTVTASVGSVSIVDPTTGMVNVAVPAGTSSVSLTATTVPYTPLLGVSNWISYVPTILGTTTDPVKGTPTMDQARYMIVGNSMHFQYEFFKSGSVGSNSGDGLYHIQLPGGYTVDTTVVTTIGNPQSSANGSVVGTGMLWNGGSTANQVADAPNIVHNVEVVCISNSHIAFRLVQVTGSAEPVQAGWGNGTRMTAGMTAQILRLAVNAIIPIN